jgi:hypothetical protein
MSTLFILELRGLGFVIKQTLRDQVYKYIHLFRAFNG